MNRGMMGLVVKVLYILVSRLLTESARHFLCFDCERGGRAGGRSHKKGGQVEGGGGSCPAPSLPSSFPPESSNRIGDYLTHKQIGPHIPWHHLDPRARGTAFLEDTVPYCVREGRKMGR